MDTRTHPARERLSALREAMHAAGVQGLIVPSSDPHLSEYLSAHWQGRAWFSGFTGSMGTLVLSAARSVLCADSRYWEQAGHELAGSGIELLKVRGALAAAPAEWLLAELPPGATVAVDGQVLGLAAAQALRASLEAGGLRLDTGRDLLAPAWPDRPALPRAPVVEHLPPHASTARADKLGRLRQAMAARGASHHLISSLDDLAWLFNLRGQDVDYNPVFLGHALVEREGPARLFIAEGKIDAALAARLAADGVQLAPYDALRPALAALPPESVLWLDPRRVTLAFREALPPGLKLVEAINPTTMAKSRKTAAEAGHVREAMARDGAAQCAFYAWFEQALGREAISELTIDERLSAERARQPGFRGLSFPVIAGFNANGAMPHYRATPEAHAMISTPQGVVADGLLLIDSGGQYLGGTTDITRVWPVGTPSAAMRRDFTRVLQGTIALSRAVFPRGTPSPMLDALARAPLWAERLDFGHGTGHGVGYFLNVHEGPQSISKATPTPEMAMEPGMITSVEPGLYRPGRWGVRIENLVLNVALDGTRPPEDEGMDLGEFLAFETLSLCPIDTRCIERSLLREDEAAWLNAYHATVHERLRPLLDGAARDWLDTRCQPLA